MCRKKIEVIEVIHNLRAFGTLEGVPLYLLQKQLSFSCEIWSCGNCGGKEKYSFLVY